MSKSKVTKKPKPGTIKILEKIFEIELNMQRAVYRLVELGTKGYKPQDIWFEVLLCESAVHGIVEVGVIYWADGEQSVISIAHAAGLTLDDGFVDDYEESIDEDDGFIRSGAV
jgi:hypothetical protein